MKKNQDKRRVTGKARSMGNAAPDKKARKPEITLVPLNLRSKF
jgi:hypothetical protein